MKGLIKFELINVFKGISFYVCLASIILMSVISVGVKALSDMILFGADMTKLEQYGYSGQMFLLISPSQSDFPLLIGILATILICSGYSQKTYRNQWGRGFSRGQVYFAKCFAVVMASIVYVLASMIMGFVTGTIFWGVGNGWNGNFFLAALIEIIICISIGIMYASFAFIFKKMALAIVFAVMSPSLLTIGSTALDFILEYKGASLRVSQYVLSNTLYVVADGYTNMKVLTDGLLCGLLYIVTFAVAGYFAMRKDEI